ncbi:MAG: hypothetical protein KDA42_10955 [Planctomycetales bacterium]|nr:hypothetical protein [Planctomycetales bacterium]
MEEHSLEHLRAINDQLARSNGRVMNFIARLTDRVDELVSASLEHDWSEVRRQSEFLANSGEVYGFAEMSAAARAVCQRIDEQAEPVEIKRQLMKLVGRCGTARADRDSAAG